MSQKILIFIYIISSVESELQFLKKTTRPPNCSSSTALLIDVLLLACENISDDQTTIDACSGCFQRVSQLSNQQILDRLRECSQNYFMDPRYQECSSQIDNEAGPGICSTGYCKFVTCLRRVNSDLLIAQCYEQASADNDADLADDQIILIKNVTSCILARTRCASINPITGQRQTNTIITTTYDQWGNPKTNTIYLYNALQITPEGDLRIVRLPSNLNIQNQFCTSQTNLRQTQWMEFSC